jgi:manganese/iron transport system permease protein
MLAVLITPAASAAMLATRVHTIMALAAVLGVVSGVVGLYLSYYFDIASGAAVVLVATALFAVIFVYTRMRRASVAAR